MLSEISQLFDHFQPHLMAPGRIPVAVAAIGLVSVAGAGLGPVFDNANPLIWIVYEWIFGRFGDRLDRPGRAKPDLLFRGFLITALAVFIGLCTGAALENSIISNKYYGIPAIVVLSFLLTSGAVWRALLRLSSVLEGGKRLPGGYLTVARSTRTNLSSVDDYGITRAGMGYAARAFDKGMICPVFWYLIGGFPAIFIYSALASLAWRFGKDGFNRGFGQIPLSLEQLMGIIPGILAGLYIALAGVFTPTAGIFRGLQGLFGHKNRAPYEQGGLPLNALAWSLKVTLGGPRQDLSGSALQSVWTGPEGATAKLDHLHLRRALYISVFAHILFILTLCGGYLWWERF